MPSDVATLLRIGWIALLCAAYGGFWLWYGGKRRPVTLAEAVGFLDRAKAQRQAGPSDEHPEFRGNIEKLVAQDDGREFLMVNLETEKKGGAAKAAGVAYGRTVLPLLLKRGSFPVYVGTPLGPVYGAFGAGINRVAVVRYRSLYDLLDMIADPAMAAGGPQKFAALDHTEVFASRPTLLAVTARLTVGMILALLGAFGWLALGALA